MLATRAGTEVLIYDENRSTLVFRTIERVLSFELRSVVFEDGCRIGEVNSMLAQIRPRLALIPLKPHSPAHMHKRT